MSTTNDTTFVRLVQLTFHPERIEEFLALFDNVAPQIRSFDGCEHLELLQNSTFPNVFSTYSYWDSEASLGKYRKSDLFITTWAKTKKLFAAPPKAVSYYKIRQFP